jgi:single-stranded DNA-specific DHH superfamily exonuclease|tara:strand:+ start:4703 stop:5764 length:1062 start_codon:yes stop_codon:yes gene_type:complete
MLNNYQISQIKEHLNKAQNPLFFFDNDADGLCSFLLLQRFIGRGKGVAIKSFPELTVDYFRKVSELNADYIFILDKALVSEEFFEKAHQSNIPIVWIDHHDIDKVKIPEFVNYYNPIFNSTPLENKPTSYLCYQASGKKEDMWIAVAGCISDKFFPDFYSEFKKNYPDLSIDSENAFEMRYKSQIGKITNLFNFALMDRTTNVVNMTKFLMKVKTPYEVLEETNQNYTMHQRYNEVNSKYQRLLEKAKKIESSDKILFFKYGGDLSISSDLSNELTYLFPEKVVVVVYVSGIKASISVRGEKIREIVLKIIEGFEDASGGGHENAVGVKIKFEDLEEFKKRLEEFVEDNKIYK